MEPSSNTLLLHCRAGFEPECAQEIQAYAAVRQASGYCQTDRDSALVQFVQTGGAALRPAWRDLIFARQCLMQIAELRGLDPRDRLTPILAVLGARSERYVDAWVETPDNTAGAQLKGLTRSFEAVLIAALRKHGYIDARSALRLHVCMLDGINALVAEAEIATAAPWPMGIPRLKLPRDAPSRSALKIEEAWLTLMSEDERARWLAPGLTAVDLGAAPGGWTWQLARRSLRVTAIDNGPLAPQVMATGLVTHLREDGFRYRPPQPVDWIVCDMVEQPIRIATLIGEWLAAGHARAALFNLKLPMKKRWQETQRCFEALGQAVALVGAASATPFSTNLASSHPHPLPSPEGRGGVIVGLRLAGMQRCRERAAFRHPASSGTRASCPSQDAGSDRPTSGFKRAAAEAAPTGRSKGHGRRAFELRAKQLYHDREEITVLVLPRP